MFGLKAEELLFILMASVARSSRPLLMSNQIVCDLFTDSKARLDRSFVTSLPNEGLIHEAIFFYSLVLDRPGVSRGQGLVLVTLVSPGQGLALVTLVSPDQGLFSSSLSGQSWRPHVKLPRYFPDNLCSDDQSCRQHRAMPLSIHPHRFTAENIYFAVVIKLI